MSFPSEAMRSELYATLIGGPYLSAEDRYCPDCKEQWHDCECNAAPPSYAQVRDHPSLYRSAVVAPESER